MVQRLLVYKDLPLASGSKKGCNERTGLDLGLPIVLGRAIFDCRRQLSSCASEAMERSRVVVGGKRQQYEPRFVDASYLETP